MSSPAPLIQLIPIKLITVINPRSRNQVVFQELVTNISRVGLKKPITVSQRADGTGYDLVCGEGRLRAMEALGETHIPAVVISASLEDCYVMSLVENLARRAHSPLELMREIGALKTRGYAIAEIALKTGFSEEYVYAACYLLEHGEERLLSGVERGIIPPSVAMEIVRAKDADVQHALAEAYERKEIPGNQALAIRRIVAKRNSSGKALAHGPVNQQRRKRLTSGELMRDYKLETGKLQLQIKKAQLASVRLAVVKTSFRKLRLDETFATALANEGLYAPAPLASLLDGEGD